MEQDTRLLVDLVAAMSVALAGGWLATRLGLSSIIGYVLTGMLISPFTPGFVGDVDQLRLIADIGVVLLMFGVGVQFSVGDLTRVGKPVIGAAFVQVAAITLLGWAVGEALGWGRNEALFIGAAAAITSSTVMVKLVGERGEIGSPYARISVSWSLVQDLSTVVLVALLVALTERGETNGDLAQELALAAARAAAFILVVVVIGVRVVPWFLDRISERGSRELFVLAVGALALGAALASERAGLSLALGAFIAGLVVSESDLSHRVLGELLPARDVFAVLFFISVGMLIDPGVLQDNIPAFVVILVLIVVVKGLISFGLARLAGVTTPVSILTGGAMAQAAEFSFVLIALGLDRGAVSSDLFSVVVAATAFSVVLAAPILSGSHMLVRYLQRDRDVPAPEPRRRSRLGRHAVVAGYGDVGRFVTDALAGRFEVVVVDQDARALSVAAERGLRVVNGDASNPAIIEQMGLDDCRVLIVALPDPFATRLLVERARQLYPDLDVIARAVNEDEAQRIRRSGGDPIVADQEVSLEMIRHGLYRFGVDQRQALAIVQRLRQGRGGL